MRRTALFATIILFGLSTAAPLLALNPGTDIFVPAAARGAGSGDSMWVTDLYVYNPGTASVDVDIYWLPRDADNSGATPETFTVNAGETMVLDDVIQTIFGTASAGGAFRVMTTGTVMVNARIYNQAASGDTFGQGFEGVPVSAAIGAGSSTDFVGLADNGTGSGTFRTNIFAVNTSSSSSSVTFSLLDTSGAQVASKSYTLQPYAAFYKPISDLGGGSFDEGTVHAEVTQGSAIVVGSKVDNGSGDPTTLESWWSCGGAATPAGTYYGTTLDGEGYINGSLWLSIDGDGAVTEASWWVETSSDCFVLGGHETFDVPEPLSNFAAGMTIQNTYDCADCGAIDWTLTLQWVDQNSSLSGSITGSGSGWSGGNTCLNATYDSSTVYAGHAMVGR